MPRCKSCNEPAVPGGRRYCSYHLAKMKERQRAEAALPRCATEGCNQGTRNIYCGTCTRERAEEQARLDEELWAERAALDDRLDQLMDLNNCATVEDLKVFILKHVIPRLGPET